MKQEIDKIQFCSGLTLLEMVIAMVIMAAIFAVLVPQLKALQNSWNSRAGSSEILQNGRVLIDHLQRTLASASKLSAVSGPAETEGFIQFYDVNGDLKKYDVVGTTQKYINYGSLGHLKELAGPVSEFQITCYDACDLDTPLNPVTAPALVKCVNFEITFPNSSAMGQDLTLNTKVYLRTGSLSENSSLVGWWKLDDASGLTAVDSSVSENDGTLENMAGDEWTGGTLGGALEFDGDNDYVDLPIGNVINSLTDCTITSWVNWTGLGNDWQRIWDFGSDED
jgi:type II secretory pathway pseudopilin PulG